MALLILQPFSWALRARTISRSVPRAAAQSDHSPAWAAFSCWILLLVTQTSLVSAGRVDIHRRLGIAGSCWRSHGYPRRFGGLPIRSSGWRPSRLGFEIFLHHSHNGYAGFCDARFFSLPRPLQPPAHKRLIFVATTALLIARHRPLALRRGHRNPLMGALFSYMFLPHPGGLRPVVHAQGLSRHALGRRVPHLRATGKNTHGKTPRGTPLPVGFNL